MTPLSRRWWRLARTKAVWTYLTLALLTAGFLYPFVRTFSNIPDYGVFLNGADLLNHGAIPSRDFVEPQGPGSFVWLALFFRVFGTTLGTARGVLIATGVGMGLLIFYLSRKLGGTGLFAMIFVTAISIPVLPINSPHYDSNLFALGALALFLVAWDAALRDDEPPGWALVLSAALCGVTTWMIQQKGCYLALALLASLIYLLRDKAWPAGYIFAGVFAAVALLPFAYYAAVHALPDVWYANYVWPISTYSDLNAAPYGFPAWQNLKWSMEQHAGNPLAWVGDFAFAIPFLLVATVPVLLPAAARWSGRRWFAIGLVPYWLAAYALWAAELHRVDIGHLRNGAVLMVMLFFTICEMGGKRFLRRVGLGLAVCVAMAASLNFKMSWENDVTQETRRGEIHVKEHAPVLDFLEAHTRAGDEVFVYPYQPIYYFFEDLKNPTRYSYLNYHLHTDAMFVEATRDLERKQVRYVVFDNQLSGRRLAEMFPAYRHPEKEKLIMERYLEAHYRVVEELGRFRILERRSAEIR